MGGRREPQRTCVGCRLKAERRELLRMVRVPGGLVRVDPSARADGRGAYVHRDMGCADLAIGRGAIARSLRTGLSAQEAARLRAEIEQEVGP